MISRRAHAQEFVAAHPQRSLRHTEGRAKFGHVQLWANMCGQRMFEPDHNIGVASPRFEIAAGTVCHQAIDKRVKQFLLDGSRDLWVENQLFSRFSETTDF